MRQKKLKALIGKLKRRGVLDWLRNVYKIEDAKVYLVGGAVRDALLARASIKDFDFVVGGIAMTKLGELLKKFGRVDLVGRNFGVYKLMPKNKKLDVAFDIALPRKEISLSLGAYRDFKIDYDEKLDIRADLGRRDFTVNAMAYEIKSGELIDEFGGLKDLANKTLKTVGDAYERFEEDYSRMLRGLRLACELDYKIEEKTWRAIKKYIKNINQLSFAGRVVPYEIIGSELLKSFCANPAKAFDLFDKSGASRELMPELEKMKNCPQPKNWHSEGDVWRHTRLCLKNLDSAIFKRRFSKKFIFERLNTFVRAASLKNKVYGAELVMAALWHDTGKPYTIQTPKRDGIDRIRFNNHDVESARMARANFEKLKLSAAPEFDFNPDRAVWLISKHHLYDTKTLYEMKNSTLEKYFFDGHYSGEDLLKLGFIDMLSSLRPGGTPGLENFWLMVRRINELKKLGKGRELPKPLLNGREVMKIMKLKPGRQVGEILESLREKQLSGAVKTKKAAREYARNQELINQEQLVPQPRDKQGTRNN